MNAFAQLSSVEMFALQGMPEVAPDLNVGELIVEAMARLGKPWRNGDILAIAQKIISKSENRFRWLHDIEPTDQAREIAKVTAKDPRKVQAILDESSEILRVTSSPAGGLVIARHHSGWVCANAGIDESNLGTVEGALLLLPADPDASAKRIADYVHCKTGIRPGVVITDTFGRPWRKGLVNVALGLNAVPAIVDWIGKTDAYGRQLEVSQQALADEIAAASGLLMLKDAATPVVVFRGLRWNPSPASSGKDCVRLIDEDLFK